MKPIAFSGMMCRPQDVTKEGEFKIKGVITPANNLHPEIVRYEHFPSSEERNKRYEMITKLLKENR